jgi:hypothetical protein
MKTLDELRAEVERKRAVVDDLDAQLEAKREAARLAARPMLAGGKRLSVWMLVDDAGTSVTTPEQEYASIEEHLRHEFANVFDFRRGKRPHDLTGRRPDLYVIDYGGLSAGCPGGAGEAITDRLMRELIRQIDDHPNTAFVLWSSFTESWYAGLMGELLPGVASQGNVMFASRDGDGWIGGIKRILG